MGVKIDISFDNLSSTFRPTELLTGSVSVSSTDHLVVKELQLTFRGEGEVHWTAHEHLLHQNSDHSHHHHDSIHNHHHSNQVQPVQIIQIHNEETYLDSSITLPLFPSSYYSGSDSTPDELPAGFTQQVPFSFQLPPKLPSSCELAHGSIKYFVENVGDLDLALENGALSPVTKQEVMQFYGFMCCCKKGGEFMLKLNLPKKGYVSGEEIAFQITYKNESTVTINKITATLIQTITYITVKEEKAEINVLCEETENTKIFPGNEGDWRSRLLVPNETLPTDLGGCRIMLVRYTLKVIGQASWARNILLEVPITIGTPTPIT